MPNLLSKRTMLYDAYFQNGPRICFGIPSSRMGIFFTLFYPFFQWLNNNFYRKNVKQNKSNRYESFFGYCIFLPLSQFLSPLANKYFIFRVFRILKKQRSSSSHQYFHFHIQNAHAHPCIFPPTNRPIFIIFIFPNLFSSFSHCSFQIQIFLCRIDFFCCLYEINAHCDK